MVWCRSRAQFVISVQGNDLVRFLYLAACELNITVIARNLGHETPRAVTRGNLKTDRDAEVYRDFYGHSRKMANISLRLKENKNVQLNYNRLLYYGANYVKITTK